MRNIIIIAKVNMNYNVEVDYSYDNCENVIKNAFLLHYMVSGPVLQEWLQYSTLKKLKFSQYSKYF